MKTFSCFIGIYSQLLNRFQLSWTGSITSFFPFGFFSKVFDIWLWNVSILHFCFPHLNLTNTVSFSSSHAIPADCLVWLHVELRSAFYKCWLQKVLIAVDGRKKFNFSDLQWWYCALLVAFLYNWTIFSLNKRLQFLVRVRSVERISGLLKKPLVRRDSLEEMSSTLTSSAINSSFGSFSYWLLVQTVLI